MIDLRDLVLRAVAAVPPSCTFEYAATHSHLRMMITHAQGELVVAIWERNMHVRVEGHRPIAVPTVKVPIPFEGVSLCLLTYHVGFERVVGFERAAAATGRSGLAIPCIENADRIFAAVVAAQVPP